MRLGSRIFKGAGILGASLGGMLAVCALSKPAALTWEKPIAPGLVFREEVDYASHHSIFALRISLQSTAVRPLVALAGGKTYKTDSVISRLPVSKIVSDESALAGVNGDFFSMEKGPSGDPLGISVRDGRLLSTPSQRVAFGWGPVEASMSTASFAASIDTKNSSVKIDGINRRCPNNEITLNTVDAGQALSEGPYVQVRVRLSNPVWQPSTALRGRVISVTSEPDNKSIAPNEAVLTGRGNKIDVLNQLNAGTECYIKLKTSGFDWEKIDSVIGGGPVLVKGGQIEVDSQAEGFNKAFSESKHPRTAIGRTSENDLWIVAVDGRQETGDGMSLDELAHLMKRLGCVDAMNLDGGGSTTMNVLGVTVNRPSDGNERPIADAVLIAGPKPAVSSGRLRIASPTTVSDRAPSEARVLDDGVRVPDREVIWGATGACAIDGGGKIQPLHPGKGLVTAYCRGRLMSEEVTVN